MIGNTVTIANKLEVLLGNVIIVPGCEPVSDFTSTTLAANMTCKTAVIKVEEALEAIPGSTLEFQTNPRRLFFVLPSGPPLAPNQNGGTDWYARLRCIGPSHDLPKTIEEIRVDGDRHGPDFFLDDENVNVKEGRDGITVQQACNKFPLKGIFG
jgi:hypothetical protein